MKLSRRSARVVVLSALVVLGLMAGTVLASVTLSSFTATTIQGQPFVSVEWETGSELNTAGFYISRSTTAGGGFVRQNPTLIPSQGDGVTGWQYDYPDEAVVVGATYYYQLEVVNNNQSIDYFGPVTVTAGVIGTLTPTPGGVAQPTWTFTPTPSRTPTRAASPTFTNTPTPGAATAIATATPTFAPTAPPGSTLTPVVPQPTTPAGIIATPAPGAATSASQVPLPGAPTATPLNVLPAAPGEALLPTSTPLSVAAVPPNPAETPASVPMAPLVVATQGQTAESAPSAAGAGPALLIIAAAVLLLGGGLYAILRITSKPA